MCQGSTGVGVSDKHTKSEITRDISSESDKHLMPSMRYN